MMITTIHHDFVIDSRFFFICWLAFMLPIYNFSGLLNNNQFKSTKVDTLNIEDTLSTDKLVSQHVHVEQSCCVKQIFCSSGNVNVSGSNVEVYPGKKIIDHVTTQWCTKNAYMDSAVTDCVYINNSIKFDKNVDILGDLQVQDVCVHKDMMLDGSLNVSKTLLADTINIFKDALFDKNVLVGGDLIGNEILATGTSVFEDVVQIEERLNVMELKVDGDTHILGSIIINSELSVGTLSFNNIISSDYNVHIHNVLSCNTLIVNQNTYINDNIMFKNGMIVHDHVLNMGRINVVDAPVSMYHSDLKINDGMLICDHRGLHTTMDDTSAYQFELNNHAYDADTMNDLCLPMATFKTQNIDASNVILSSDDFDESPIHFVWRQMIDPRTLNDKNVVVNDIENHHVAVSMGMGRHGSTIVSGSAYPKNAFCFERHVNNQSENVFHYNQSTNQLVFDHDGTTNDENPSIKTARICLLGRFENPNPDGRSIWYKQGAQDSMVGSPYWGPDRIRLQSDIKPLARAKSTRFWLENQVFYLVRNNQITNTPAFTFLNGSFTLINYGLMMIGYFDTDLMIQSAFSENSIQARHVFHVGDEFPIWGLANTETYEGTLNVLNVSNDVFLRRNVSDVKGWFTLTIEPGMNHQIVMNMGLFRQARENLGERTLFQIHGSQIETFVAYPPI